MLEPLHRWIWRDPERRAHKLLRCGDTETDGGGDLVRAAELTADPLLRRLYLVHAEDPARKLQKVHAESELSGPGRARQS